MSVIKGIFNFLLGETDIERAQRMSAERRRELAARRTEKTQEKREKREEEERERRDKRDLEERRRQDKQREREERQEEKHKETEARRKERVAVAAARAEVASRRLEARLERQRVKKNPKASAGYGVGVANDPDLATARRMSSQFHGKSDQVVELESHERNMPKYAMVAGEVTAITYLPCEGSKRSETEWHHESGDRGMGQSKSENRPLLVIDPQTKRPAVVMHKSPMKFSSRKGLIG